MSQPHPSYLELDRLALGEPPDERLREHVASCARCKAHLENARRAGPVPAWVGNLDRRAPRRARTRWLWAGGFASAAAAAALLVVFTRTTTNESGSGYTTVKGSASVAVHIKRGNRVSLWDGHSRVMPADALRLEVVPDGHRYVAVFAERVVDGNVRHAELYAGPLPDSDDATVLPKAWKVDAEPGPETIIVVMSNAPVSEDELRQGTRQLLRKGAWVRRLTFEKEVPGTESP